MKKGLQKIYLQQKKRYLKKIVGTSEKPRLAVFRSHKHIYAQLIDDDKRKTMVSAKDTEIKSLKDKSQKEDSKKLVRNDQIEEYVRADNVNASA